MQDIVINSEVIEKVLETTVTHKEIPAFLPEEIVEVIEAKITVAPTQVSTINETVTTTTVVEVVKPTVHTSESIIEVIETKTVNFTKPISTEVIDVTETIETVIVEKVTPIT